MKVIVCIKQVPDTKGGVKFNPDGTLDRGAMLAIMNPDDKAGLEAALRLKDQYGAEVTVLTMGLPKASDVLREALAMGADKGILVTDRVLGGADTWATSTTIAGAIRNLEYDLIITGRQAIDGDTAQVGPQIAEHLGIPVISYAQEIKIDGDKVIVKRQYDDRYHMLEAKMPCLITALSELNEPRYMTPGGIFDAVAADITTWGRPDLKDVDDSNLGLPVISYAEEISVDEAAKKVTVKRQFDDRYMMVEASMPCLVTALAELNEPRYMTPGGIFDACAAEITTWGRTDLKDVEDSNLGLAGSPTKIAKASDKVRKGAGEKVTPDSPEEAVSYIVGKLDEKHAI